MDLSNTTAAAKLERELGPRAQAWVLWSCVVLFTLIVRARTFEMLEVGGDPFEYVLAVKRMLYAGPEAWEWTHHSARFSLLLPSALVFGLMGGDPLAYYVVPLLLSVATSCLLFAALRRFAGVPAALLVVAAVVLFPGSIRNFRRSRPSPF